MYIFLIIFIIFLILLEASITTIPLVLLAILLISVISKKSWIFLLAFSAGLMIDLIKLNPIGKTSLFLTIFLFIVLLYDKKFEIRTVPFVFMASFLGSIAYLIFFGYRDILFQAITSSIIGILSFIAVKKIMKSDSSKVTL
ncbi:MAG: hypothetical protein HYT08_05200 [Candidatus Levybacteria bacterium]|nr:hypothetical protein [Candidatus Levybacteria bacterium]